MPFKPRSDLITPPKVEPPEFDLKALMDRMLQICAERRIRPVRFLTLVEGKRQRVPGLWRPNMLRGCKRKQVYKAVRAIPQVIPYKRERQLWFDRGHVYGAWVLSYFQAMEAIPELGVTNVRGELLAVDSRTQLGGYADISFDYGGHTYIVEVKSKDDIDAFLKVLKPDEEHLKQLNDYMVMRGVSAGWVLYIGVVVDAESKKTQTDFKLFFHRVSRELWADTEARTNALMWYVKDQSRLPPESTSTWLECPSCEYKHWCDRQLPPAQVAKYERKERAEQP